MKAFCENRRIPPDDPDWLFGNLYANRLIVLVGANVSAGDRTFSLLQPGGVSAWPEAFETEGLGDSVVHGGFYLFDEGCDDPEKAEATAKREMAKAYFDAGLPEESEPGFLLTVADEPKNSMAWFHLGQIFMNRGEFETAQEAFESCISGEGGSLQPVLAACSTLLRGHCFDLEGRRGEAVAEYEAVIASGIDFQDVGEQARKYIETPFTEED